MPTNGFDYDEEFDADNDIVDVTDQSNPRTIKKAAPQSGIKNVKTTRPIKIQKPVRVSVGPDGSVSVPEVDEEAEEESIVVEQSEKKIDVNVDSSPPSVAQNKPEPITVKVIIDSLRVELPTFSIIQQEECVVMKTAYICKLPYGRCKIVGPTDTFDVISVGASFGDGDSHYIVFVKIPEDAEDVSSD